MRTVAPPRSDRKPSLVILPKHLFSDQGLGYMAPVGGCLSRYSRGAANMLVYLIATHDYDDGSIPYGPAVWARSHHHNRHLSTVVADLAELVGDRPTPSGAFLQSIRRTEHGYRLVDELQALLRTIGSKAHRPKPGPYAWTGLAGNLFRCGLWGTLTESQRTLYVWCRFLFPAEVRTGKNRDGQAWHEGTTIDRLAERTGLARRTVVDAVKALEHAGLLQAKHAPWTRTVYSCVRDAVIKVAERTLELGRHLGELDRKTRRRFVLCWHEHMGRPLRPTLRC